MGGRTTLTNGPPGSRLRRTIGFTISSAAMVIGCFALGWVLARAADSPVAAFGSAGFASIVGGWALSRGSFASGLSGGWLRFRKRMARLLAVVVTALGIAALLFILYLMARNN